jgi:hypothetical protein
MLTTEITTECPYCHRKVECATTITQKVSPKDGDVSVCIECLSWGVFVGNPPASIRVISENDLAGMPQETYDELVKYTEYCKTLN